MFCKCLYHNIFLSLDFYNSSYISIQGLIIDGYVRIKLSAILSSIYLLTHFLQKTGLCFSLLSVGVFDTLKKQLTF